MFKAKKVLSVILSFVMIFGVLSTAASAAVTVINTLKVNIDANIEGVNADDYESYINILTEGITFDDADDIAVFVYEKVDGEYADFHGNFIAGNKYSVSFYLITEAGYKLADGIRGYINDTECIIKANPDYGTVICTFDIVVGQTVNFPKPDYEGISKIDITVDTDIAGVKASDFKNCMTIGTKGLALNNVYVTDSNRDEFNGNFKAGETYYFTLMLVPEKGYDLTTKVDCFVNGEKADSLVEESWVTDGPEFEHVFIDFEITVDAEEELSFFARIIQFFKDLFAKIFGF